MDQAVAELIGQFGALNVDQKREFREIISNTNEANLRGDPIGRSIVQCANFYLKNNIGNNRFTNGARTGYAAIIADLHGLGLLNLPNFDAFNAQVQTLSKPERFQAFMDFLDQQFTALNNRPFTPDIGQRLFILDSAIEWMNDIVI
jgi:hypothetical protein